MSRTSNTPVSESDRMRARFPGRNGRCRTSSQSGHSRGSCVAAGAAAGQLPAAFTPRPSRHLCCVLCSGSGEHHGWVALSRREGGLWVHPIQRVRNLRNDVAAGTSMPPENAPVWFDSLSGQTNTIATATQAAGGLPAVRVHRPPVLGRFQPHRQHSLGAQYGALRAATSFRRFRPLNWMIQEPASRR